MQIAHGTAAPHPYPSPQGGGEPQLTHCPLESPSPLWGGVGVGVGWRRAHGPFHARFPGSIRAANLPRAAIFALA
jgi:hypothetical protein